MKKFKRIGAWIGIIIIAGLLLLSIVSAFIGTELSRKICFASIASLVAFSIILYVLGMFLRMNEKNAVIIDSPDDDAKGKKQEKTETVETEETAENAGKPE